MALGALIAASISDAQNRIVDRLVGVFAHGSASVDGFQQIHGRHPGELAPNRELRAWPEDDPAPWVLSR